MGLEIKDIKNGMHFWEKCWEFEALEDGYKSGTITFHNKETDQWRVKGKNVKTGEIVNFLKTDGSPYGPNLDAECMYVTVKTLESLKNTSKLNNG